MYGAACATLLHGPNGVSAHLALAVAGHAVRVQRQERALEMSSRTAQFTQGDLELLGLLEGVTLQQIVDRQVGRDEGQVVGQLKNPARYQIIRPSFSVLSCPCNLVLFVVGQLLSLG